MYEAKIDAPKEGWSAFFVQLIFDVGGVAPLKVTTAIRVLPDRLPHSDLDPAAAPLEKR